MRAARSRASTSATHWCEILNSLARAHFGATTASNASKAAATRMTHSLSRGPCAHIKAQSSSPFMSYYGQCGGLEAGAVRRSVTAQALGGLALALSYDGHGSSAGK